MDHDNRINLLVTGRDLLQMIKELKPLLWFLAVAATIDWWFVLRCLFNSSERRCWPVINLTREARPCASSDLVQLMLPYTRS